MAFCTNCGQQLIDPNAKFCPHCGTPVATAPAPLEQDKFHVFKSVSPVSPSREQILADLERCNGVVTRIFNLMKTANGLQNHITDLRGSTPIFRITRKNVLVSFLITIVVISTVTLFNNLGYRLLDSYPRSLHFFLQILFGGSIFSILIVLGICLLVVKRKNKKRAVAQRMKNLKEAGKLELDMKAVCATIDMNLESEDGVFAKAYIPQDYFYPEAVSMFVFYIRNGQADNMKEALKEYDQYLHRCKLEYEASRAANASERAARASERAASAAEQSATANAAMSQSMRQIEEYEASTNFWTIYNALTVHDAVTH